MLQRSVFGFVQCYNRPPQAIVEITSVKYSRRLLFVLMNYAELGAADWQQLFSFKWRLMPTDAFHALFRD